MRAASKLVVAKGRKVTAFAPGGKAPADAVEATLGPTGNLRAPTARVGKVLLVGFDEETWLDVLG